MNSLEKTIDKYLEKVADLQDCCSIVCNEQVRSDLLSLQQDIVPLKTDLKKCRLILEENPKRLSEARDCIREMRRQEIIMRLILDKLDLTQKENNNPTGLSVVSVIDSEIVTPISNKGSRPPMPQSSVKKIPWNKHANSVQRPASSCKRGPNSAEQVSLGDFVYSISEKEFQDMPKYLKGRENLDDLQRFVDELICPCLVEKYALLQRPNSELTNFNLRQLKRHYKDQEHYFPGHYFVTDGDLSRFTQSLLDKRLRNRIQMLRQLGVLKEMRKKTAICYLWMIRIE